ncbi:hypothetical protein F8M41_020205 [Gigaspora margarita]|uniref:Uncharacterized protein n=1 Tax=Gigaspora margarita TaxID=4874 RepID=A0A8H4EK19_GIGMA|nr:hypothetical protein F8M41_020205 [Gigaspora margarita]
MTIYQICLWICANPNILQLANHNELIDANYGLQFIPSISSALSTTMQNQTDKISSLFSRFVLNISTSLKDTLVTFATNFKNEKTRPTVSLLQKEEIIAFVNESATLDVLNRWLSAMNIDKLRAQNSISHLCKFIQSAFAVNYRSRDIERTRALDRLTKNFAVPSRNGKNFASNIKL